MTVVLFIVKLFKTIWYVLGQYVITVFCLDVSIAYVGSNAQLWYSLLPSMCNIERVLYESITITFLVFASYISCKLLVVSASETVAALNSIFGYDKFCSSIIKLGLCVFGSGFVFYYHLSLIGLLHVMVNKN